MCYVVAFYLLTNASYYTQATAEKRFARKIKKKKKTKNKNKTFPLVLWASMQYFKNFFFVLNSLEIRSLLLTVKLYNFVKALFAGRRYSLFFVDNAKD